MNLSDFTNAIEIMCDSLPTQRMESRIKSLFKFYNEKPLNVIRGAAEACSKNLDRFPTPRQFGEFANVIESQTEKKTIKQNCILCDGFGWVVIDRIAYRGRCKHSNEHSEKIALAPSSYQKTEETFNPVKVLKGLLTITGGNLYSLKNFIKPTQVAYERVRGMLSEDQIKRISAQWEENKKTDIFSGVLKTKGFPLREPGQEG